MVDASQSKTRDGRNVDISPNVSESLMLCPKKQGPIFHTRASRRAVFQDAGVEYGTDILRHTFGTWHWAKHRHEGETAIQMGDSIATVKRYYVNTLVNRENAERFWAISPSASPTTVTTFPAQQAV